MKAALWTRAARIRATIAEQERERAQEEAQWAGAKERLFERLERLRNGDPAHYTRVMERIQHYLRTAQ